MPINKSDKTELLQKLNELLEKQSQFQQAINKLQREITQLKFEETEAEPAPVVEKEVQEVAETKPKEIEQIIRKHKAEQHSPQASPWQRSAISSEVEQFIGTNLINKIGMAVVIIGVGIGTKYAIDNNLISPLVRIILGYLVGAILTFFAVRLKKEYFNFSAVLISGAMAIHYFITYAAYSYYSLYPNSVAFILMVLFTVITVALALYYNRQVIAHFGLVGAYLVPFLVGDPDASVVVLFTYMVIINSGILFISTKKRWKPLNYLAFLATWVIFLSWFVSKDYNNELGTALTFSVLFFLTFYLVFLSYKLLLKEQAQIDDIPYLLLNTAIFFFIGITALNMSNLNDSYGGLFSLINAVVHGFTAYLIYKADVKNNLFFWTVGFVITFVTIAIGLQFNDYYSAILWSLEAAFLFWFGRSKRIELFDYLSFALITTTFIITVSNWVSVSYPFYGNSISEIFKPVFNLDFLASVIVILSFSFIYYTSRKLVPTKERILGWLNTFNILFPISFLIVLFFTFYTEIDLYWNNIQVYTSYQPNNDGEWVKVYKQLNQDIFDFKTIWLINYSMLFTSVLAFVNFKWLKNTVLNAVVFVMSGFMILIFLGSGLAAVGFLRESYLNTDLPANYDINRFHLLIRYVAYSFFAILFYSTYRFSVSLFPNKNFIKVFEIILSVSIIWICSSELIDWLSLSGSTEVYKHGLSILWGVLSFILVGYGIWKQKKHLRITSIVLFAGTLIKLFVYDLTNLDTIQKTIVFLSIGAILLIVSFIYNKYREVIFGKD
ncbi:DUF2339 domain-containing protein [Prolixibacteraceae bacterium Z1-6]|uniref:DUF2339 domain-containing protein n=1 Tax=Draconibacterium aestuarii TaxID=2998507 RepID=A0A9X3F4G6_9BACT|nr:DUF2339 domain-containing protein [Prolixibacteraceae bacterium Z1-6]